MISCGFNVGNVEASIEKIESAIEKEMLAYSSFIVVYFALSMFGTNSSWSSKFLITSFCFLARSKIKTNKLSNSPTKID